MFCISQRAYGLTSELDGGEYLASLFALSHGKYQLELSWVGQSGLHAVA
jgi:hypothetical protein